MGKPTSTISAPRVHSILRQFNYDFVPAEPDRDLKQVAKATARDFPGVKISRAGDSVYFRYTGDDGRGPSKEFFVQARGMLLEETVKGLEKITGIKFSAYINS